MLPDPMVFPELHDNDPIRDDVPTWVKVVFCIAVAIAGVFAATVAADDVFDPPAKKPACWFHMEIGSDRRC
jgi:hypothetical protein